MAATHRALIKNNLLNQLKAQGKSGQYYNDLVDDYLSFYDLKKELKEDIKNKGLRYTTINGNGMPVEKPNESIINLTKVNTQMLKILNDLNLQKPNIPEKDDGKDDGKEDLL